MSNTFKYTTAILAVALLCGSTMTSWAQPQKTYTDDEKAAIKTVKGVKENSDGSFTIKLETWVAGDSSSVTKKTSKSVPLDIVLLLDVSGSMKYNMSGSQTSNVPVANQRITALKNAVNNFVGTIKENGATNSVTHRISLVKFSTDSYPTGTTTSNTTTYYPLSSAAYSYNGYGYNTYYIKVGENYYQVYREKQDVVVYNALESSDYTPNDINDGEYYYKHTDGNYYKLYRGGSGSARTIYFMVNRTTVWYLHGTTAGTDKQTYDKSATAYTGVLYQKGTSSYRLYYTVGSTKHYLSGTTETTTAPTNVIAGGSTIWTGVLYKAKTANTPDNIVEGNTNPTQVVKNFTNVDNAGATALTTATNSLTASGATYADYGMELVKLVFSGARTDASKVLILFTDGDPGYSGFDDNVANSVIESSRLLKDQGVKVYTIGTFSNPNTNQNNYMGNTSSNYPYAISLTDNGTTRAKGEYYHNVTSASELENVFQTISEEATTNTGGEGIELETSGTNAVHLADIITSSFVIPNGSGNSSVRLKQQVIKSIDLEHPTDSTKFVWYDEIDVPDSVTFNIFRTADTSTPEPNDSTTTVDIQKFDFSNQWVGPYYHYENDELKLDQSFTRPNGAKLVIYIDIVPDPEAEGGLVPTNSDKSGVYVGGVLITNDKLKDYITPEPVFTPMDLKIEIEGLGENENAIFNVKGGDLGENGMNIILTSTTEGSIASATIAKVPLNDAEGRPYTYTVTLDEKWIWAYTAVEAEDVPNGDVIYKTAYTVKEHALYNAEKDAEGKITSYTTNHIFKFKIAPKEGVSGHGENFRNNEFKIMPKAAATE